MVKEKKHIRPRRGELYLVNFDPTIGSEIKKTRPAVVIQNDVANMHSPVTIVAAVSSQFVTPIYPTEVLITSLSSGVVKPSVILLNHIRTIDTTRLIKKVGRLSVADMAKVHRALEISLGLIEL